MKKIFFPLLSLVLFFCGIFVSACGKSEISLSLSDTELSIYTNDPNEENYKSATLTVKVKNSSAGITANVESSYENILSTSVSKVSKNLYEVEIKSVNDEALTSTGADVVIKSLEGEYETSVKVFVYAKVLSMSEKVEQTTDNKTNFYLIKGLDNQELNPDTYISFNPSYSNIKDITWSLFDEETNGVTINDNKISVSSDYSASTLKLMATSKVDPEVYTTDGVTFAVIDDFNIDSFVTESGESVYDTSASNPINLGINQGQTHTYLTLNIDANYDIEDIDKDNYELFFADTNEKIENPNDYLQISQTTNHEGNSKNFIITLDANGVRISGNLKIRFKIGYKEYNHVKYADCYVSTFSVVTEVDVTDKNGFRINDPVDVFSSYVQSYGEEFNVTLNPNDVPIKNATYNIIIDTIASNIDINNHNLEDYLMFFNHNGLQINFQRVENSTQFITKTPLVRDTKVFAKAGSLATINENIQVQFVSTQNVTAKKIIEMNLYSVNEGSVLPIDVENSYVTDSLENIDEAVYLKDFDTTKGNYEINLSALGESKKYVVVKILGSSSLNGLSITKGNDIFNISELTEITNNIKDENNKETYVIASFEISLKTFNIEDSITVELNHINGSKLEVPFKINSFFPIENGISIGYEKSVNIAQSSTGSQSHAYYSESGNEINITNDDTLSSLVISYGSSVALAYNTAATISKVEYYYLVKNDDVNYGRDWSEITTDNAITLLLEYLNQENDLFIDNTTNTLYTIKNGNILESYSNVSQSFIVLVFTAYDENHNEVKIYRSFYFEVYVPLNRLSSSVKESTLYTTESLSSVDYNKASVEVSIKLRNDSNSVTYTDLYKYFTFESGISDYRLNPDNEFYKFSKGFEVLDNGNVLSNTYYMISNFRVTSQYLNFVITALTLSNQQYVNDKLIISYNCFNVSITTQIDLHLLNADRVEKLTWVNKTSDGSLYFEINSVKTEIPLQISVEPSDAYNTDIKYFYSPISGFNNAIEINEKTGLVSLNRLISQGGYGYLYILPYDMIKNVNGVSQILYYVDNVATYVPLNDISSYYDTIIQSKFINNDNEEINVSDLVLRIYVRIADGLSKTTALRIYSEKELKNINENYHYEIMNNITLSSWNSKDIKGGIYGSSDNDVTLTFLETESFVNSLEGYLENLTINGVVKANSVFGYQGFVVNENHGLIKDVKVDVYTSIGENYKTKTNASMLISKAGKFVGGIAGINYGEINSVRVAGLTIKTADDQNIDESCVGGIVGKNVKEVNEIFEIDEESYGEKYNITSGLIKKSNIQFYTFEEDGTDDQYYNYIQGNYVGAIVGEAGSNTKIDECYAYAYQIPDVLEEFNLIDSEDKNKETKYASLVKKLNILRPTENGKAGAFCAKIIDTSVIVNNSFSVVNVEKYFGDGSSYDTADVNNSYISYIEISKLNNKISNLTYRTIMYVQNNNDNINKLCKIINTDQYDDENNLLFDVWVSRNNGDWDYLTFEGTVNGEFKEKKYTTKELFTWVINENFAIDKDTQEKHQIWISGSGDVSSFSTTVNNGLPYLYSIQQDAIVTKEILKQQFNTFANTKNSLGVKSETEQNYGILYYYNVNAKITASDELSTLKNYNTISFGDLFNINGELSNSIYVSSSNSTVVSANVNSLTSISTSGNATINLTIGSKQNYNIEPINIEVLVINYMASLEANLNGVELNNNDNVNIQVGKDYTKEIVFSIPNVIYLGSNSNSYYLVSNNVNLTNSNVEGGVDYSEYLDFSVNGLTLSVEALKATEEKLSSNVTIDLQGYNAQVYDKYQKAINDYFVRTFNYVPYLGAHKIDVTSRDLAIKASTYASTKITIYSDNRNDTISVVGYDNGTNFGIEQIMSSENSTIEFVNDNIGVDMSYTRKVEEVDESYVITYNILFSVNEEFKTTITSLKLLRFIFEASSIYNLDPITVDLTIEKQDIENIDISNRVIKTQSVRNNRTYYLTWNTMSSTISPGASSILSVEISPEYAYYDYFDITYQSETGKSISISLVNYNSVYGYYVVSTNTSPLNNGLRITPDSILGSYNFKLFVPTSFNSNETVKITLTFVDVRNNVSDSVYYFLNINYLNEAEVLVNDSTAALVAKGKTATVTVKMQYDQELDSLTLQNVISGVSIYDIQVTANEEKNERVYTAILTVSLSPVLTGEDKTSTGNIFVAATVSRVINGVLEMKTTKAKVSIVDFDIDAENITIKNSTKTIEYRGKTYDLFTGYIGLDEILGFNIPLDPENYYSSDAEEIKIIAELNNKRNEFSKNYYYSDPKSDFYVNYEFNVEKNCYEKIELYQQLRYVDNDGVTSHAIYNSQNNSFNENDFFSIDYKEDLKALVVYGNITGEQLMMLRTIVYINNEKFVYDYYFVIKIDIYTDEDTPAPIFTTKEFYDIQNNQDAGDYILMNDIVLDKHTPFSTEKINSFDGNSHTIFLNDFDIDEDSETSNSTLDLALFTEVKSNTTLKNVRVNVYNGGKITIDISKNYSVVNIAGLAITNSGIITNCEVVSFYDSFYNVNKESSETGIVVNYINGAGTSSITLNANSSIQSNVAGFVITNSSGASITNSRVGGETAYRIGGKSSINSYYYTNNETLEIFNILAQGSVAGFVIDNAGKISSSYVDNIQITNSMNNTQSTTAGFVINNTDTIQTSYVEGVENDDVDSKDRDTMIVDGSSITSIGEVAGFVHTNSGLVKNSYSNISIVNEKSQNRLSAGFVYVNEGRCYLCYSASLIEQADISAMNFSGISPSGEDLNSGTIELSYYYSSTGNSGSSTQSSYDTGAIEISVKGEEAKSYLYGFSFSTESFGKDGIWTISDERVKLISANNISISNRYIVYNNDKTYTLPYTKLIDEISENIIDTSYGSERNPIIVRNAEEFAEIVGESNSSSISKFFDDNNVFGNYRFVNNIDFSELDQNAEGNVEIKSTTKTFGARVKGEAVGVGKIDGNGFSVSNISLGSYDSAKNFGLFASLNNATIVNLDLSISSIRNARADIVGALAGLVIDSDLIAINVYAEDIESVNVQGKNIVGGLVGAVFGDSRIDDVTVNDIYVWSDYIDNGKINVESENGSYLESQIYSENGKNNGFNLREKISRTSKFYESVEKLSYAGGIVGYVDIYLVNDFIDKAFDYNKARTNLSINKVRVKNSINVLGEVVGGMFGYVGYNTYIRDASLEIYATSLGQNSQTRNSYITSKNLYAGGIVGESYGVLESVYARYEKELQETIENNIYTYYKGNAEVERGQESIFDYSSVNTTEHYYPLFVGGLVGYAGSGLIYVGYNKLNVISSSGAIVGGIVGKIASNGYYGDDVITSYTVVESEENNPSNEFSLNNVNYSLEEVYSSGDVRSTTSVYKNQFIDDTYGAGGIIGSFRADNNTNVYLKRVNAVNYFGINTSGEPRLYDNTYSIVADFEVSNKDETIKNSNLYFYLESGQIYSTSLVWDNKSFDSSKKTVPVIGGTISDVEAVSTVGMIKYINYSEDSKFVVPIAKSIEVELNENELKVYAANNRIDITKLTGLNEIVPVSDIQNIKEGYTEIYNNFLGKGWSADNWSHKETLYPEMLVGANNNIIYLDCWNIESVLASIKRNPNVTVIVRGETSANSGIYNDVDMTDPKYRKSISGFSGTLMGSYSLGAEYKHSDRTSGDGLSNYPKLLLSGPLFDTVGSNVTIKDLRIDYQDLPDDLDSLLISSGIVNGNLNNLIFGFTSTVKLAGVNLGIIAPTIESTSLYNIQFNFYGITDNSNMMEFKFVGDEGSSYSAGLITGTLIQKSMYSNLNINGVSINCYSNIENATEGDKKTSNIGISVKAWNNLNSHTYVGGVIGKIQKAKLTDGVPAKIKIENNVFYSQLNLKFEKAENKDFVKISNLRIGNIFGSVEEVDTLNLLKENYHESMGTKFEYNLILTQSKNVKIYKVNAGLIAGNAQYGSFVINPEKGSNYSIEGNIYVKGDNCFTESNIGGLFGSTSSQTVSLQKFSGITINIVKNENDEFTKQSCYGEFYTADNFICTNKGSFGLIVGSQSSGSVNVNTVQNANQTEKKDAEQTVNQEDTNTTESVEGNILVKYVNRSEDASIGSLAGQLISSASINFMNLLVDVDIFVEDSLIDIESHIGGIVGLLNNSSASMDNVTYNGDVKVNNILLLNFGGIVGKITENGSLQTGTTGSTPIGVIYGGALEVFKTESKTDSKTPTAITSLIYGGIVGLSGESDSSKGNITLQNSKSSGDLFVYYDNDSTKEKNVFAKFESFTFGGLIGQVWGTTNINNCNCITTNHNTRETTSLENDKSNLANYKSKALIGNVSSNDFTTTVKNTYYSSTVCLAFDDYGIDAGYGVTGSNGLYNNKLGENIAGGNILDSFTQEEGKEGSKTNPINLNDCYKNAFKEEKDENNNGIYKNSGKKLYDIGETNITEHSTHGVTWYYVSADLSNEIDNEVVYDYFIKSESLKLEQEGYTTNYFLAGNGYTVNYKDIDNTNTSDNGKNVKSFIDEIPTYSVVSSLKIKLDIQYAETDIAFGGAVEKMTGGKLYAVGTTGKLSVGGTKQVYVGGVVGLMTEGYVTECSSAVDIIYRGGKDGTAAPLLILSSSTSAKAYSYVSYCYTTGNVESYIETELYAYIGGTSGTNVYVRHGYTISKLILQDYTTESYAINTSKLHVDLGDLVGDEKFKGTWTFDEVYYNKTYILNKDGSKITNSNKLKPLSYSNTNKYNSKGDSKFTDTDKEYLFVTDKVLEDGWAMSIFYNYGYAYRNFSHLIEVTTYTAKETSNNHYEYVEIEAAANLSHNSAYYYGINNLNKLKILESSYNYLLVDDLDYSINNIGSLGDKSSITLDGQNYTIKNNESNIFTSLSNSTIRNLRIMDFSVTGAPLTHYAEKVNVYNITVSGHVTGVCAVKDYKVKVIGGLIGVVSGKSTIENVNSLTYITYSENGSIDYVGGIVGFVHSNSSEDEIKFNNNSYFGTIILNTTNSGVDAGGIVGNVGTGKVTIEKCYNSASINCYTESSNEHHVGGIVGNGTNKILNCYNTGLIKAKSNYRSYAGGIVGRTTVDSVISNCTNDGSVEAIVPGAGNFKIEYGNVQQNSTSTTPGSIDVYITYNPGTDRNVFAFGIGYVEDAGENYKGFENCSISDDCEIKNNGNIGETTVKQTFTFKHPTTESNGYKYYYYIPTETIGGKTPITITSYDEYGMPTGILMHAYVFKLDTKVIQSMGIRSTKLSREEDNPVYHNSEIKKLMELTGESITKNSDGKECEYGLTRVYEAWNLRNPSSNENAVNNGALLETATEYSSDYNSLITYKGATLYNVHKGFKSNIENDTKTDTSFGVEIKDSTDINSSIETISNDVKEVRENKDGTSFVKINGSTYSVVNDAESLSTIATGGKYVKMKATFSFKSNIIAKQVKAKNFTITYNGTGTSYYSHSTINSVKVEDSTVELTFTMYFSDNGNKENKITIEPGNVGITCNYEKTVSINLKESTIVRYRDGENNISYVRLNIAGNDPDVYTTTEEISKNDMSLKKLQSAKFVSGGKEEEIDLYIGKPTNSENYYFYLFNDNNQYQDIIDKLNGNKIVVKQKYTGTITSDPIVLEISRTDIEDDDIVEETISLFGETQRTGSKEINFSTNILEWDKVTNSDSSGSWNNLNNMLEYVNKSDEVYSFKLNLNISDSGNFVKDIRKFSNIKEYYLYYSGQLLIQYDIDDTTKINYEITKVANYELINENRYDYISLDLFENVIDTEDNIIDDFVLYIRYKDSGNNASDEIKITETAEETVKKTGKYFDYSFKYTGLTIDESKITLDNSNGYKYENKKIKYNISDDKSINKEELKDISGNSFSVIAGVKTKDHSVKISYSLRYSDIENLSIKVNVDGFYDFSIQNSTIYDGLAQKDETLNISTNKFSITSNTTMSWSYHSNVLNVKNDFFNKEIDFKINNGSFKDIINNKAVSEIKFDIYDGGKLIASTTLKKTTSSSGSSYETDGNGNMVYKDTKTDIKYYVYKDNKGEGYIDENKNVYYKTQVTENGEVVIYYINETTGEKIPNTLQPIEQTNSSKSEVSYSYEYIIYIKDETTGEEKEKRFTYSVENDETTNKDYPTYFLDDEIMDGYSSLVNEKSEASLTGSLSKKDQEELENYLDNNKKELSDIETSYIYILKSSLVNSKENSRLEFYLGKDWNDSYEIKVSYTFEATVNIDVTKDIKEVKNEYSPIYGEEFEFYKSGIKYEDIQYKYDEGESLIKINDVKENINNFSITAKIEGTYNEDAGPTDSTTVTVQDAHQGRNISGIIIGDDIDYGYSSPDITMIKSLNIIGTNHIVVFNKEDAVFIIDIPNNIYIRDLILVVQSSNSEFSSNTRQAYGIIFKNAKNAEDAENAVYNISVYDMSLYGNIRNVNSNSDRVSESNKLYILGINVRNPKVNSFENYLSVNGLKEESKYKPSNGVSITGCIVDNSENNKSYAITNYGTLYAGSGSNGFDGANGTTEYFYDIGGISKTGTMKSIDKNAGEAGSKGTVEGVSSDSGISQSGKGGTGGNGGHGEFGYSCWGDNSKTYSKGGKAGGIATEGEGDSMNGVGGCGGVGGFGTVYGGDRSKGSWWYATSDAKYNSGGGSAGGLKNNVKYKAADGDDGGSGTHRYFYEYLYHFEARGQFGSAKGGHCSKHSTPDKSCEACGKVYESIINDYSETAFYFVGYAATMGIMFWVTPGVTPDDFIAALGTVEGIKIPLMNLTDHLVYRNPIVDVEKDKNNKTVIGYGVHAGGEYGYNYISSTNNTPQGKEPGNCINFAGEWGGTN